MCAHARAYKRARPSERAHASVKQHTSHITKMKGVSELQTPISYKANCTGGKSLGISSSKHPLKIKRHLTSYRSTQIPSLSVKRLEENRI